MPAISVLGPVELTEAGADVPVPGMLTRRALSRLLLARGAPVSSAEFMDALWGELRDSGVVRTQLNRLRRIVEPTGVMIRTGPLGWSLDRSTYTDSRDRVHDFVDELAHLRNPIAVSDVCSAALALWSGPSLVEMADLPWAEAEATRLERTRETLRIRLAESLAWSGNTTEAQVQFALLSRDQPFNERAAAWQSACLADLGQFREALDVLEALRRRLRDEIGCSPSELPRQVEQLVLAGTERITSRLDLLAPLEHSRTYPKARTVHGAPASLTGRDDHWESLTTAWPSDVRVVLVVGEQGSGKTSLADAYGRHRSREGALVLWGAFREDSNAPHEAFVEALNSGGHDPRLTSAVAELRLLQTLGAKSSWAENDALQEARSEPIGHAFATLLQTLGTQVDVVVVFDDAHWADADTHDLLNAMSRSLPRESPHRIDLLVVSRSDGPLETSDRARVHAERLAQALSPSAPHRIALLPLTKDDISSLLTARGRATTSEIADALFEMTGGNAFLVNEVATHFGDEIHQLGRPPSSQNRTVDLPLPIRHSLANRLKRLSDDAIAVATVTACYRTPMPESVLHAMLPDLDDSRCQLAIHELVVAGIVEQNPHFDQISMKHGLYEFAVLDRCSTKRRHTIHRQIADFAIAVAKTGAGTTPSFIVEQLLAAGPLAAPAERASWLVAASAFARANGSYEAAARNADLALSFLGETPSPALVEALAERQLVAAHSSDIATSKSIGARLVHSALRVGDHVAAAHATRLHCAYGRDQREDPDSIALADVVIERAHDHSAAKSIALAAKSFHYSMWRGDAPQARDLAQNALRHGPEIDDAGIKGECWYAAATAWLGCASFTEIDHAIGELRRNGLASRRLVDVARSWRLAGLVALQRGDSVELNWAIDEMCELGRQPGQWHMLADVARWRSTLANLAGRFAEAEHHRCEQRAKGFGGAAFEGSAIAQHGLHLYGIGRLQRDHSMFAILASNRTAWISISALDAVLSLRDGIEIDIDDRLSSLIHATGPDEKNRNRLCDLGCLVDLAEAAAEQGYEVFEHVSTLRSWLEPYRGSCVPAGYGEYVFGSVDRFVAVTESLLGHTDTVDAFFLRADQFERARGWNRAAAQTASARLRHAQRAGLELSRLKDAAQDAWDSLMPS